MNKPLLLSVVLLLLSLNLSAQSVEDALRPVTHTYALKNVTIVQQPGKVIKNGTVVVKDGLIHAVGTNVSIPAAAKVLEADSMYVYAGFIDALSNTAVPKPKQEEQQGRRGNRPDVKDPGNPPNDIAGVQPERSAADLLKANDKSVADMRKLGFTAAHVVPHGRMLPGQGAFILLNGEDAEEMVLKENVSMYATLQSAPGVFPATVIGVMTKFRELYKQAELAKGHQKAYAMNPAGMARPEKNDVLEAFFPVIDGQLPVFFKATDIKSAYRVFALQKDLGFPLVLSSLEQGWQLKDHIVKQQVPVLLSLDLPEAPKGDKKEKGKEEEEKEGDKKEEKEKEMDPEKKALEARRKAAMKQYLEQAGMFAGSGVNLGFSTIDAKTKGIHGNLLRLIENGLSEEQALSALTTTPAAMFGVDKMLGTVEKGKIANLVVSDKPYFEKEANVRFVIVDGDVHEYEAKAKKKGNPNAKAKVNGSWSYTVNVPNQASEGTLTLIDNDGDISGSLDSDQGGSTPIKNASLNGNELAFTSTYEAGGESINLQFTLIIDGESFEGTVDVGSFGSFEVEGTRTGAPE